MKIRALTHQADLKEPASDKSGLDQTVCVATSSVFLESHFLSNTKAAADGQLTADMYAQLYVHPAYPLEDVTNRLSEEDKTQQDSRLFLGMNLQECLTAGIKYKFTQTTQSIRILR